VHEKFTVDDINNARKQFSGLSVLAHPECSPEVVNKSDFSGSTTGMVKYVKNSEEKRFLLLTECSMGDNIIAENPEKDVVRMCSVRCPHMSEITLEDTLLALRENKKLIELDSKIAERARHCVAKMLTL